MSEKKLRGNRVLRGTKSTYEEGRVDGCIKQTKFVSLVRPEVSVDLF